MSAPSTIVIGERAYRWRDILAMRRAQLEAWRKAQPQQPALFALIDDCRPQPERTAAGRYEEPGLPLTLPRVKSADTGRSNTEERIDDR